MAHDGMVSTVQRGCTVRMARCQRVESEAYELLCFYVPVTRTKLENTIKLEGGIDRMEVEAMSCLQ